MMMDPSIYTTSVRDKIILLALIIFGLCAFTTIWVLLGTGKAETALVTLVISIVTGITNGLFGIYKGNPSTPDVQTQTTTSETKVETQAGTETKAT